MLLLGAYTIKAVRRIASVSRVLKIQRPISITLYEKAMCEPDAEALQEKILLPFSDGRGAYKRTYRNRFESFDALALQALQTHLPKDSTSLAVLDAGISDGRTAVDFFRLVQAHCPLSHYEATDYDPEVFILTDQGTTVTCDRHGQPLEVLFPPFVFYPIRRADRFFLFNSVVWLYVKSKILPHILELFRLHPERAHKVQLFCKAAQDLQKSDTRFVLGRHNLLEAPKRTFQVIRAMNVLNVSYFTPDQMQTVVRNLLQGLEDGGLLITGSNQDAGSIVDGGIYRKAGAAFTLVASSGGGSPVHDYLVSR